MEKAEENSDLDSRPETLARGEKHSRLSEAVFLLLALILVFAVVAFGAVDAWALGFLTFLSGAIIIFWLADAWRKKEFRCDSSPLQLPLLGLILIGVIQLLPLRSLADANALLSIPAVNTLSLDAYATQFFIIQLFVYVIFFAAALTFIDNQKRLRNIVIAVIAIGAAMAVFGVLQRLAGAGEMIYGVRPTRQAIPFASFVNQHHFAAFMNMTLGLSLGLVFGGALRKDKILLLLSAAFLMIVALILTGSRGGLLSFVGVSSFLLLPKFLIKKSASETVPNGLINRFGRQFALIIGLMVLLAGVLVTVSLLGGDQSLLRGIGLQNNQADASNGRIHFWSVALQIFFDYPILGAGLNAFGAAFTQYDTWNGAYRIEQAHNDYLQILADAGILGFACVAAFIYFLFKKGWPAASAARHDFRSSTAMGALAGCFGILVHGIFDFPLRTPSNAFFFLILAALATVSISHQKKRRRGGEMIRRESEY